MKRIILFAHYDKDNIIDDYVLRYLEGLKPFCERLVIVSDSELDETEKAKISDFCEIAHATRHGEYDFGSWKRAYAYCKGDLDQFDEVLMVNDSCFGPLYSFDNMFETMAKNPCDFWGLSGTHLKKKDHRSINSYFMAFRPSIIQNKRFQEFWSKIKAETNKSDIVYKYEMGLSDLIHAEGFKSDAFMGWFHTDIMVSSAFFPKLWAEKQCPLVKVKLLRVNPAESPNLEKWLSKLDASYPRALIDNLVERYLGTSSPAHYFYKYPIFKNHFGHPKLLSIKGGYTKNKKWWRCYVKILGIPLMMVLPSRRTD